MGLQNHKMLVPQLPSVATSCNPSWANSGKRRGQKRSVTKNGLPGRKDEALSCDLNLSPSPSSMSHHSTRKILSQLSDSHMEVIAE